MSATDPVPTGIDPRSEPGRMDLVISTLLRSGVLLSMALIFIGLALMFLHNPSYVRSAEALQRLTSPGAAFPHALPDVIAGLRDRHGQSVVALGLLILILTPILRVAISIVLFALERDHAFVVITTAVLSILIASFFLGKAG